MIATAERTTATQTVYELLPFDPYAEGSYTYMVQSDLPAGVTLLKPLSDGMPSHIGRGHSR